MRTLVIAALLLAACGDDDKDTPSSPLDSGIVDASSTLDATMTTTPDSSVDAGPVVTQPSDCFVNPTTYTEIINACTDAERVEKNPVLPLLGADGKLPPLP